ncbi:long-chain fatty acid--CoA ligase [Amycolatopsis sp. GM8]|uniref:long-chain fatty acid--CoA ligase n=1 Tax=Amycolatopsis sp. GM8 TaxID=2896530 RepID=UPI001F194566|nr:long-chain fatty acid--CoA ligase [Amycolatopsis sp. GM8]
MAVRTGKGAPLCSTMMDRPLLISALFTHGARVHGRSRVHAYDGSALREIRFSEVASRVERLARGLRRLGVRAGDRVGTLMWNTPEHLELYFAVPGLGAVLHTANPRVLADHIAYAVQLTGDEVLFVHHSLVPIVVSLADRLEPVRALVLVDDGVAVSPSDRHRLRDRFPHTHTYEEILAEPGHYDWPDLDERSAAVVCFTSGTTGEPKGVVYSHRSSWLHTLGVNNSGAFTIAERDSFLVVVPMFHVNAWGYPYAAWTAGADIVLPSRHLGPAQLATMIEQARVTLSAGVPTVWRSLLTHIEDHPEIDLSSIRHLVGGGSAVPRAMVERFAAVGVDLLQGWGMTETSPVCAVAAPPADARDPGDPGWRTKTGRIMPGVDVRIVTDDARVAEWDGATVGEIQVRGPWVTGSYLAREAPERFDDGWLRTGDIGHVDDRGFLVITDRAKDVIKSGGEWISSVALENEIMSHPDVAEACVVAVEDAKWGERPLAAVVCRAGAAVGPQELREWLAPRFPRSWLPDRWEFVTALPRTSVGKFDKKLLRATVAGPGPGYANED